MTPTNFRRAVESLRDWSEAEPADVTNPGTPHNVIAMIGGNPCLHPRFDELCAIFRDVIPNKRSRGLWTNNLAGRGKDARDTFGWFSLNVHGDSGNAAEMRRELSWSSINGHAPRPEHSRHAAVFTAVRDFIGSPEIPDEAAMWQLIEGCDINRKWSGSIIQIGGEIFAFFCEIAATFEAIYGHKTGIPVTPGWWKLGMDAFDAQSKEWCPKCGVPLRMKGHMDNEQTDDFSKTHETLVQLGISRGQKIQVHDAIGEHTHEATDYQLVRGGK